MLRTPVREPVDQVSQVLGDSRHLAPYYPEGLTEACLGPVKGPLALNRLNVSRFYLFINPPVVVDYERAFERFYVEEKRKFFIEQGIVYVPIFLRDRLSREQFKVVVKDALLLLRAHQKAERVRPTPHSIEAAMQSPEVQLRIDDMVAARPMPKLWGAAKKNWLARTRKDVTALVREEIVRHGLAGE